MRDVAKECYENCEVGAVGFIKPDPSLGETLQDFQAVSLVAQIMQENGQIFIQKQHRESHTGQRHIDSIQFLRVR